MNLDSKPTDFFFVRRFVQKDWAGGTWGGSKMQSTYANIWNYGYEWFPKRIDTQKHEAFIEEEKNTEYIYYTKHTVGDIKKRKQKWSQTGREYMMMVKL